MDDNTLIRQAIETTINHAGVMTSGLPRPIHIHKWEWDGVDRYGFGCEAPGCDVYWLNPEEVEELLNEHFSRLGVSYEGTPDLRGPYGRVVLGNVV